MKKIIYIIFMIFITLIVIGEIRDSDSKTKIQKTEVLHSANYKNERYYNPWLKTTKGFKDFLRWRFSKAAEFPIENNEYLPEKLAVKLEDLKDKKRYILWIGHMTFFIRIDDNFYLLDPIFSKRIFILKRYVNIPVSLEELLEISKDGRLRVLITHNHYDHLDKKSIMTLPEGTEIIVPQGDGGLVRQWGKYRVEEMDWRESIDNITFVEAQHWSKRIGKGRNTSLWGSFIVEDKNITLFLGGDSGWFSGFKEIGREYDIDYALVSVGAYEPRWFMKENHLNVSESISVMEDLGAELMIPGHWGTFKLGDEPPGLPKYQYEKLNNKRVRLMKVGEVFPLEKK